MVKRGTNRGKGRQARPDKRPRQKVSVPSGKPPREPIREWPDHRPCWRFSRIDSDGPWHWHWDEFYAYADKLAELERRTWADISRNSTIGAKFIPIADLPRQAQRRLEELHLDDAPGLWELRLAGRRRLWGVRFGDCLHFLWWDPEHTVFP